MSRSSLRASRPTAGLAALSAFLLLSLGLSSPVLGEDTPNESTTPETVAEEEAPVDSYFAETTVTATGSEVDSFEIATPVTVISAAEIERRAPDNAADLLREEPGVDVNGVGPNQERPVIRGQRGLRVLFLENGLRMNNARRQTDFGEITGLVDIENVETVEVVRGPASVLYGSDAVGGVLNLITKTPSYRDGRPLGGSFAVRYGSAGELTRAFGDLDGRAGKFSYRLGLGYRESDDYEAASGRFGKIKLDDEVTVSDTGVEDDSSYLQLGYELADGHSLALSWNRYSAEQTGFGFVEPELIGDDSGTRVRILYPEQSFDRYALRYLGSNLGSALVDSVDLNLYQQSNERQLANLIDINIGPIFPGAPDSSVRADTLNYTDLETLGLRTELVKVIANEHILTYGVEGYQDDSTNTDFSTTVTTIRLPFPPFERVRTSTDRVPNAPNAKNTSYGGFVQGEIAAGDRLKLTVGGRYQRVETQAERTAGWDITGLDFEDDAVVGAVSGLFRVTDYLHLTASYGTSFRAPNIVERLFNGTTPEGSGFQILNPDLSSEESDNIDIGFKYRRQNAYFNLTGFRTDIDDGIIQYFLSPAEVGALPADVQQRIRNSGAQFVVQQRNVSQLRYEGIEASLGYRSPRGFSVGANYTYLDGERIDSTDTPTDDTFSTKINAFALWNPVGSRYWIEYRLRHNGEEDVNLDAGEPEPVVGRTLPSFTVHSLSGGVKLFQRGTMSHHVALVIDNLTDELYAEFSNATFFRPQPKRSVSLSYRIGF